MGPGLRKLALTAHVVSSVGWSGAVAAFLALAVGGLTGRDPLVVRAAYLSMEPVAWSVIVPFSFASLVTGVIQSVGTPWGLLRHYWVLIKLVITVVATAFLLLHIRVIGTWLRRPRRARSPMVSCTACSSSSPSMPRLAWWCCWWPRSWRSTNLGD